MPSASAHHVGITVEEFDRMVEFYRDVLGFAVVDRFTVDGVPFATAVDVPGAEGRFAHLAADGVFLELVEYDPSGEPLADASVAQPGATHFGFEVESVDATVEALPAAIETLSDPQTTDTGTRICFLRDPEGNLVELLEPDAE